jgi:hypothetical protein
LKSVAGVYFIVVTLTPRPTKVPISGDFEGVLRCLRGGGDEFRVGVSFVFYTMQLREHLKEKMGPHSWTFSARAGGSLSAKQQRESLNTYRSLSVGSSIFNDISRMNSRVEKAKLDLICPHCSKRVKWAWLIQYQSFQYTQLVYVCSECEQVIRIENAPKVQKRSPILSDPAQQRKK